MNAFPTRIEAEAGRQLLPTEIFAISRQHEVGLSRMLMAYISMGLAFMLLPGTFLGVWNLFSISGHTQHISPAWMQAHGHAQIFGWVGAFILGIGFYSIPKLRRGDRVAILKPWIALALWCSGVGLRWFSNIYAWHWRVTLPISALFELAAFVIFFRAVSGHRRKPAQDGKSEKPAGWMLIVVIGTFGFLAALIANAYGVAIVAVDANSPAFAHGFDQKFLVLIAWGFLVTTIWGFTARWVPVFLGLAGPRDRWLLMATGTNVIAVTSAQFGLFRMASVLLLVGAAVAAYSLRVFEPRVQAAKLNGVHRSMPVFIRMAYGWMLVAATLGIWSVFSGDPSGGIGGASRHALTVGFVSMMIFAVGQRVLPAFSGMRLLFSTMLMFAAMALATLGCTMRVVSEVLAYPGYAPWAWHCLPVSAVIELTGFTLFAFNLYATFLRRPKTQPAKLYSISTQPSVHIQERTKWNIASSGSPSSLS
ncbi:MAG: NnrS family protein [Terriglobales bacterium]